MFRPVLPSSGGFHVDPMNRSLAGGAVLKYPDAADSQCTAMNEGKGAAKKVQPKGYEPGPQKPAHEASAALSSAGVNHNVDATDSADPKVTTNDPHDTGKKLKAAGFVHAAHGQHESGTRVNAFKKGDTTVVVSHKPSEYGEGKYTDGPVAVTAHGAEAKKD